MVAAAQKAIDGLADLADRPAVEREGAGMDDRFLADLQRTKAERAVQGELRRARAEDRDSPASRPGGAAKVLDEAAERARVADRVSAHQRGSGDDTVGEERRSIGRKEVVLVPAEREECQRVAAVRGDQGTSPPPLADALRHALPQRAEPEVERAEDEEHGRRGRDVLDVLAGREMIAGVQHEEDARRGERAGGQEQLRGSRPIPRNVEAIAVAKERSQEERGGEGLLRVEPLEQMGDRAADHEHDRGLPGALPAARERARHPDQGGAEEECPDAGPLRHLRR